MTTDRLTETHRLAQVRLGGISAKQVLGLWALLDIDHLDATIPAWLSAVRNVVQTNRARSALLAARYLDAHRDAAGLVRSPLPDLAVAPLAPKALSTSMLVTGPYRLRKNLSIGLALQRAVETARADSAGEAMRHVLAGGRSTITTAASTDPAIRGLQRVTAPSPCSFCAMLASRGPVYRSAETADFKPHARCGCQPEPVYTADAPMTPLASVFAGRWREAKQLASSEGISPEVAFRRLTENRA